MRLSTLIRWVIFLAVLGWAGYTVAGAGWTYYAIQENVDKVLREASGRYRTALQTGTQTDTMARDIRGAIALNARRDGLAVQEADIQVSASGATISATVQWSYPVIRYGGSDLLVIPMSLHRSSVATP